MFLRTKTRKIRIGKLYIGGGSPVIVQSMSNTLTSDVKATLNQIDKLQAAGCEIVRISIPDFESAVGFEKIRKQTNIPLVADIHFDWRLAIRAIDAGADKIRINPGNIGSRVNVERLVAAAKRAKIPIRIGVNAGSLKAIQLVKHGNNWASDRARILVAATLEHVKILEKMDFFDIAVSMKASDIGTTVEAYKLFAKKKNYPLHLGITESGSMLRGTVKSSAGLGILLYGGLGDTIRVSLTADPIEEVKVGYQLLQSLGLRSTGIELISCPTCSRCESDLISIVNELENKLSGLKDIKNKFLNRPIKVAVMGCVVNGPGEAKEADIGVAGGRNTGLLFIKGRIIRKVHPSRWVNTLIDAIKVFKR